MSPILKDVSLVTFSAIIDRKCLIQETNMTEKHEYYTARLNTLLNDGALFTATTPTALKGAIHTLDEALIYIKLAEKIRLNPDAALSDGDLALVMSLALDIAALIGEEDANTIRSAIPTEEDIERAKLEAKIKPYFVRFFEKLKYFYYFEKRELPTITHSCYKKRKYEFDVTLATASSSYCNLYLPSHFFIKEGVCEDITDTLNIFAEIGKFKATVTDLDYLNEFDSYKWMYFRETEENKDYVLHYVLKYAPIFCDDLNWLPKFVFKHLVFDGLSTLIPRSGEKYYKPLFTDTKNKMDDLAKTYPHLKTEDFCPWDTYFYGLSITY